jgi:hypothetical protein
LSSSIICGTEEVPGFSDPKLPMRSWGARCPLSYAEWFANFGAPSANYAVTRTTTYRLLQSITTYCIAKCPSPTLLFAGTSAAYSTIINESRLQSNELFASYKAESKMLEVLTRDPE